MKRIIYTLLFIAMLSLFVSCTQTTMENEDRPTRAEAFYDINDFSEMCESYEGLFCDFKYPKQIPVEEMINLTRFSEQQINEFDRILSYGNDLEKEKYIAEHNLVFGEGIVFNEYATGPGVNQITVKYWNDSTSLNYEFAHILEEVQSDDETVIYKSLGADYAMVRSRNDEDGVFKMRFVALGEHSESVTGELIYDVNEETAFKKLEPFIIKSIQFK